MGRPGCKHAGSLAMGAGTISEHGGEARPRGREGDCREGQECGSMTEEERIRKKKKEKKSDEVGPTCQ